MVNELAKVTITGNFCALFVLPKSTLIKINKFIRF